MGSTNDHRAGLLLFAIAVAMAMLRRRGNRASTGEDRAVQPGRFGKRGL
jgi:hypothetical protein